MRRAALKLKQYELGWTTVTLKTVYGIDMEMDFVTGDCVRRYRADVELSSGQNQVVLEVHY